MTRWDRFLKKVDTSGGPDACWPWLGGVINSGYGDCHLGGVWTTAHRASYALAYGVPLAELKGLEMMHLCHMKLCVNPRHLRPGTRSDNHPSRNMDSKQLALWAPAEEMACATTEWKPASNASSRATSAR